MIEFSEQLAILKKRAISNIESLKSARKLEKIGTSDELSQLTNPSPEVAFDTHKSNLIQRLLSWFVK